MQLSNFQITLLLFSAFILSFILTPIFRKIAVFVGLVDQPNQPHKTQVNPVPYLGGLSISLTVVCGLTVYTWLNEYVLLSSIEFLILIAAPLLLGLVGLIDDIKNLGAFTRLLYQCFSAVIVTLLFIHLEWYGEPSHNQTINILVTIFWVVGITNSINFIDNLDGGAGGIVIICATALGIASQISNQRTITIIALLIAGSTLGFLYWNLYPARIYLGDAGALFLGSLLSILTLRLNPETEGPIFGWLFMFLLFAVPILDTTVVVLSRISRLVPPWQGGREHLSHRLLATGLSKRWTAVSIWVLQICFSSLGLMLFSADFQESIAVALFACFLWFLFLILFMRMAFARPL